MLRTHRRLRVYQTLNVAFIGLASGAPLESELCLLKVQRKHGGRATVGEQESLSIVLVCGREYCPVGFSLLHDIEGQDVESLNLVAKEETEFRMVRSRGNIADEDVHLGQPALNATLGQELRRRFLTRRLLTALPISFAECARIPVCEGVEI